MEGAIYYPTIRVPSRVWMSHVLLYWEDAATIVPQEYIEDPDQHDAYTRELIVRGLLRQIQPWQANQNVCHRFLDRVEQLEASEMAARQRAFQEGSLTPIHTEKLHHSLGVVDKLATVGLAWPTPDAGGWLYVEQQTATEYMATLALACAHPASDLSYQTQVRWYPMTDRVGDISPFSTYRRGADASLEQILRSDSTAFEARLDRRQEIEELEAYLVARVFPAPEEGIAPDAIEEFRRRHGNLLPRFRRQVQERVATALTLEPRAAIESVDRFVDECLELQAQARAYLEESGFRRIRDNALLTLLKDLPLIGKLVGGASGVAGAAVGPEGETVMMSPLAYGVLARAKLGDRTPKALELHFTSDQPTVVPRG